MVLNIGGIANLSMLIPGQPVRGYDTGPGNMLMDARIWRQCGKPYDKDAEWASEGKVIIPLLQSMLSDPRFALPAPKARDASTLTMAGLNVSWLGSRRWHRRMFRRRWPSSRRSPYQNRYF